MNERTPHSGFGQAQRRFRHRSRTGRANAGRSTIANSAIALGPHPTATSLTHRTPHAGADHHHKRDGGTVYEHTFYGWRSGDPVLAPVRLVYHSAQEGEIGDG